MRLLNPKTWWAAAATAAILVSVITASPSMAEAASSNSQSSVAAAASCPGNSYNWYMQNAPTYSVGWQTVNSFYAAVNTHGGAQNPGFVIWHFCRISTLGGAPVLDLVVQNDLGQVDIGKCEADSGNTYESGNVTYASFQPCLNAGTAFLEVVLPGGAGFRLESIYQANTTGRAEYLTTVGPSANHGLFLAEAGTYWQAWNALPCTTISGHC
jgi:hypothetical protein